MLHGCSWKVNNELDGTYLPLPVDKVIQQMKKMTSKIAQYSLIDGNCKRFVNDLRYGVPRSQQVWHPLPPPGSDPGSWGLVAASGVQLVIGVFIIICWACGAFRCSRTAQEVFSPLLTHGVVEGALGCIVRPPGGIPPQPLKLAWSPRPNHLISETVFFLYKKGKNCGRYSELKLQTSSPWATSGPQTCSAWTTSIFFFS